MTRETFRAVGNAFRTIAAELRTRHTISELRRLDDLTLTDLGIARDEIANHVRNRGQLFL